MMTVEGIRSWYNVISDASVLWHKHRTSAQKGCHEDDGHAGARPTVSNDADEPIMMMADGKTQNNSDH